MVLVRPRIEEPKAKPKKKAKYPQQDGEQVGPTPAWHPLKWPTPNHPAIQAYTCGKRFVYLPCGRGSGKTEISKRKLVRCLPLKKPWGDPRYFYAGPTYGHIKRMAWRSLIDLIPPQWIEVGGIHHSELYIRTVFGSELWMIGLDKPQRIEGNQWDGGIVDESSDIRPRAFELSILPALTWRDGWCWRIGVPKRFGIGAHEYKTMYNQAVRGEIPESTGFTWSSKGIVPEKALIQAAASMDLEDYREQFDAQWQDIGGGVFHNFSREGNVRPCMYHSDLPIIVGSDFNVDPMAWVLCHQFGNRLEVFDEIWIKNTNTAKTLNTLFERYGQHTGGFEFYGDASGKGRKTSSSSSDYAQILNDHRFKFLGREVHYLTSNPPLADRFAATNAVIKASNGMCRLHVDERCKHLIDDLSSRQYKPGTKELPADEGDLGHITDALGYVIYRKWPIVINIDGAPSITVAGEEEWTYEQQASTISVSA